MTTLHATVPLSLTRFVGRDRELTELARLVVSTRLLTLTGAGGSGKTRLAGEVTVRSPHPFEQVLWIDLAAVCAELTARKSELEVALSARESRLRGKKKPRSAGLQSVVKRSGRSLSAATIQLLRER